MTITDIIERNPNPQPWAEGEKIPWNDPDFSRRMLKEHLSQQHDMASRRHEIINRQVDWIDGNILRRQGAKILDLGCGPGLYIEQLQCKGHKCAGIDFSPASIEYARAHCGKESLLVEGDLRTVAFPGSHSLIMMLYGEINVFKPQDAALILKKSYQALDIEGSILIEAHTHKCIKDLTSAAPSWTTETEGLFSDRPYISLSERFWDAELQIAIERYYVIEQGTHIVSRYSQSIQAYSDKEYKGLLHAAGFKDVKLYASLGGNSDDFDPNFIVVTGKKGG